jgi:YD repeat-containing protein
VEGSNLR